ncbi:conserved hypothetical protein [Uncinocarpus reesii 1704]|uniref:Aminoalcoholphosphotransferase n=1 Tax=Uncinocarpus reesii (strain UAMH 1704) TaxID=336963 RepID=C4JE89_UNCRE|nr:uncharacterized protein UREG_00513 [Uncinocarpus reesii 1704]EEP75667.1 conserved hypothetical protein [Uncinocarpus reesii 1704]
MVYIRQWDLEALRQYKYSGLDKSLVSRYIMKPFYTHVVIKFFPMSMAPNLITLTGFSFVVINFLTLMWYNPGLDSDCPPWVYLSWALGLFLYQTFDAVDGTQAYVASFAPQVSNVVANWAFRRRTRQSGPLGELFDHVAGTDQGLSMFVGVDACNTALEVLIFAGTMNLGQTWATVLALFGSALTFYVQTWDEYYTQVLTLGIISGPVEGILTLCVVYVFTAVKGGGSFWHKPMLPTMGIAQPSLIPDHFYNLPFTSWYIIYGGFVLLFSTVASVTHVLDVRRQRGLSTVTPLFGLLPVAVTWVLIAAYLHLNPVILNFHLVPFALFVGIINAYSVGRMIIAHLVKTDFPYQNILLIPLLFAVFDSAAPRMGLPWPGYLGESNNQVAFVFGCLGLGLGVYGSFVVSIINLQT